MIASVPSIVQKWLKHSGASRKPMIQTVRLHQRGEMRTTPCGRWMRFNAEQYNTIDEPAFLWLAKVKMAPLLFLSGRDRYEKGKGDMLIKFLSLIPIANAKGPTIDQGALIRYMAEMVWFPAAALADYIKWEEVNSTSAKATMSYGGVTGSGVFVFTPEGDVQSFEALRYYEQKGGATLEKWHVEIDPSGFKEFEGIRIPARSTVTWKLKDGDFTWLKLEITELEYNKT